MECRFDLPRISFSLSLFAFCQFQFHVPQPKDFFRFVFGLFNCEFRVNNNLFLHRKQMTRTSSTKNEQTISKLYWQVDYTYHYNHMHTHMSASHSIVMCEIQCNNQICTHNVQRMFIRHLKVGKSSADPIREHNHQPFETTELWP